MKSPGHAPLLAPSAPRSVRVSTAVPPETRELLAQYATTCKDIRETTRALKPYRDRKRTAEQSAVATLSEPVAIRVRNGESEHTLRIVRKERRRKASLNMRTFLRLVRECEGDDTKRIVLLRPDADVGKLPEEGVAAAIPRAPSDAEEAGAAACLGGTP